MVSICLFCVPVHNGKAVVQLVNLSSVTATQMPRFTYQFSLFNLLFKAISKTVQNIAFEIYIPVHTLAGSTVTTSSDDR